MTTYIKFDVDVMQWNVGGRIDDDEWSRDSYDGSVTVTQAIKVKDDGYDTLGLEEDVQVGQIIYLVWAQYSTGDSFSRSGGQYVLLDVFTDRQSAEAKEKYYNEVTDYSVPWTGYFECLDFVQVQSFTLT